MDKRRSIISASYKSSASVGAAASCISNIRFPFMGSGYRNTAHVVPDDDRLKSTPEHKLTFASDGKRKTCK